MNRQTIAFVITLLSAFGLSVPLFAQSSVLPVLPLVGPLSANSIHDEPFDLADAWEHYARPDGVELGVENGIYRAFSMTPGYVWGLNAREHDDVVVEVDVTPLTIFQDNAAGVMCRADTTNTGNGYYFMINARGYFSIQVGQNDQIAALVDWQPSEAIHSGIDHNRIMSLCVGEHLAMYVNDELVAYVTDSTYATGYAGLAVAAGENGVDMAFDNLTLYEVEAG